MRYEHNTFDFWNSNNFNYGRNKNSIQARMLSMDTVAIIIIHGS